MFDIEIILSVLVGIGVPTIGAVFAYGKLHARVKDHAEEMSEIKARVAHAESQAGDVKGLALAVEHMGERFTDRIEHLINTFSIENGHTRSQLADIKEEVRSLRGNQIQVMRGRERAAS